MRGYGLALPLPVADPDCGEQGNEHRGKREETAGDHEGLGDHPLSVARSGRPFNPEARQRRSAMRVAARVAPSRSTGW